MHIEEQLEYKEPTNIEALTEEPLCIHCVNRAHDSQLVIFVHGLNGSRYGDNATWGNFPKFLFEDIPYLSIGLYKYRTGLGRLKFWRSISVREESRILSDIIRDELSNYKTIVLVGHSMGGLLCKAAIAHLVSTGARDALSRIGGLILMASPQLGSVRVPGFLSAFSSDAQVLKAHSDFVAEVSETFENNLYVDENINAVDKATIPTWAVQGASDFWVDKLSSGIGLTSSRKKIVRGTHTEIVKPANKEADVYSWVRDRINRCLNRFKYDVFISSAMAGLRTEEDYQKYRNEALHLEEVLKYKCNFKSIFYAGRDIKTKAEFEAQSISLEEDFYSLRDSRYFLLLYPEKIVSSVLFEAGWAIALGKPSVYYVRDRNDLPFLMAEASAASLNAKVTIYEYGDSSSGRDEIVNLLDHHGERLWKRRNTP